MKPLLQPFLWCPVFALLAFVVVPSRAADAPDTATGPAATKPTVAAVEVSDVVFDSPVGPGNPLPWQEIAVELKVNPSKEGNYVSHVRVTLTLGTEVTVGTKHIDFYRASAEAVALKSGAKAVVRFYLPPEIVDRDSLHGETKYFAAEVSVGGQVQPASRESHTRDPKVMPNVQSFLAKAASDGAVNDGILLPQMLTPFEHDNNHDAPTFIRSEAAAAK
jgi:hypothetical protein